MKSSGRPRVCEISLITVDTSDVLDMHEPLLNSTSGITNEVKTCSPRIVNKLGPGLRGRRHPAYANVSGLQRIENQK